MKRILLFVLFALVIFTLGFIQDGGSYISFQVFIKPGNLYTQTTRNTSYSVVTFNGSQKYLDELKAKGIPNPTIKADSSLHTTLMATGKMNTGKHFQVIITTDNPYIGGTGKTSQDKITVYGQCFLGNLPILDSVSASAYLDSNIRSKLMQSLETSLSRLNLPQQRLRLKQSFTNTEPLKIPFGNNIMEVILTTTYRLTKISDGVAYFSTSEVYGAKMEAHTSNTPAMLGKGRGKFEYDIKKNYYVTYQTADTLYMHLKYNENLNLDIKSINGYKMGTTIVAQQ